jgi:hypothetical protein
MVGKIHRSLSNRRDQSIGHSTKKSGRSHVILVFSLVCACRVLALRPRVTEEHGSSSGQSVNQLINQSIKYSSQHTTVFKAVRRPNILKFVDYISFILIKLMDLVHLWKPE